MSIFDLEPCSVREATIKVLKLLPESIAWLSDTIRKFRRYYHFRKDAEGMEDLVMLDSILK